MTPCQLWIGAINSAGYGLKRAGGKVRLAHVVAWEAVNGPVPDGHQLHHRCEVEACVRVDHLEALTSREHARRHAKLTPAKARAIRTARGSSTIVGLRFGVSGSQVRKIRLGLQWADA